MKLGGRFVGREMGRIGAEKWGRGYDRISLYTCTKVSVIKENLHLK